MTKDDFVRKQQAELEKDLKLGQEVEYYFTVCPFFGKRYTYSGVGIIRRLNVLDIDIVVKTMNLLDSTLSMIEKESLGVSPTIVKQICVGKQLCIPRANLQRDDWKCDWNRHITKL